MERIENNLVYFSQCYVIFLEPHLSDDLSMTTEIKHQMFLKINVKKYVWSRFLSWFPGVIHQWLVTCLGSCILIAISFLHSFHISTYRLKRYMKEFLGGTWFLSNFSFKWIHLFFARAHVLLRVASKITERSCPWNSFWISNILFLCNFT